MITKRELCDLVASYTKDFSALDEGRISEAYDLAKSAHQGQKRDSNEPFFSHPAKVAETAAREYNLDADSIIAALLHDTVEDTETDLNQINLNFGKDVANLIQGLTKLKSLKIPHNILKAENYRNFILSVSKDIRVLIIKLIDREHNISTLHFKDPEKQKRIAKETMNIYIPLAERMGMEKIKNQMEDTCFKILEPDSYAFVSKHLLSIKQQENLIDPIVDELTALAAKNNIPIRIFGRQKTPYSIWNKMHRKNIAFEKIFDIIAFRFIVETVEDCYKVLGLIHSNYKMVPNRFKDFISTPKPNKYQSLHTTIIDPRNHRIEVQIRTEDMDRVADFGFAAHWLYKQNSKNISTENISWLKNMVDAVKTANTSEDMIEEAQLPHYLENIFCFTPTGDLLALPQNATALDFAYEIHGDVGNRTTGAKVNKVMCNIKTPLHNGDSVEIITSKSQEPSREWLRFAQTTKAKSHIKKYLKLKEREQTISFGKNILVKFFSDYGKDFDEKSAAAKLNVKPDEMYCLVGSHEYSPERVLLNLYPELKKNKKPSFVDKILDQSKIQSGEEIGTSYSGIPVYFAKCCFPIPGDAILGVVHNGKGIRVHRADCRELRKYISLEGSTINISWEDCSRLENGTFRSRMLVLCSKKTGTLNTITTIIAKNNAVIDDIKVVSKTDDFMEFLITVDVKDISHLDSIIAQLKFEKNISTVKKSS